MQSTTNAFGATLSVNIQQFRPLGGVFPISALFSIVTASPGVQVQGGNIVITSNQPATLVFQLVTPGFVFVGATFDSSNAGTDVGSTEFPSIRIDRTSAGNSLTVTDSNIAQDVNKAYDYVLLVQNSATGEIGIIDPAIITEPI